MANLTPTDDCWLQRTPYSPHDNVMSFMYWTAGEADAPTQITTDGSESEDDELNTAKDLNGGKNGFKHVPHKDRPPLIVARRNARERRRVQAVNCAFTRLRKVVPITNNRGKRVSKVKTLQIAIDYIIGLESLLKQTDIYHDFDIITNYRYQSNDFTTNYHNEF